MQHMGIHNDWEYLSNLLSQMYPYNNAVFLNSIIVKFYYCMMKNNKQINCVLHA